MIRRIRKLKPAALWAMAACVILQMILALAMAAAPELHERFHPDAGDAHHECVVTHLIHGDFGDGVPSPLMVAGPPALVHETRLPAAAQQPWVAPLFLASGLLVHGPPMV